MNLDDRLAALSKALETWGQYDTRWGNGPEGIILLARTGLFTVQELADICDRSVRQVQSAVQGLDLPIPERRRGEKFDPTSLDAMVVIASHFHHYGTIPDGLVRIANQRTSTSAIARMTGVPSDALLESLQRGATDTETV